MFVSNGAAAPSGPGPPRYRGSTITHRHTILGRTPLDEGSACRRDLYLTRHNTHKRQTSMPPAGYEPTIPERERPKTPALDRAAAGIGFAIFPLQTVIIFYMFSAFSGLLSGRQHTRDVCSVCIYCH
jgi:hypothetical protein